MIRFRINVVTGILPDLFTALEEFIREGNRYARNKGVTVRPRMSDAEKRNIDDP